MYDVPGDFLLTYDSKYTELHTDSSDFEDSCPAPITPKLGNHSLIKRKLCSKSKRKTSTASFHSQECTVTDGTREMWESQTIVSQSGKEIDLEFHRKYQNRKSKVLDSGDQLQTIKSKRSLMRHKVIPCLSSMFGRPSNNVKQMSIIKENQAENVNLDNGCQASRVNQEHKIRKFNRRQQCYAVQPVYAVEGNGHAKPPPFQHTKIIRVPLATHRMVENEYTNVNYSLTSSSEGTGSRKFLQRKKGKNKKNKESCNMATEYMRYEEKPNLKNRQQQCPSKQNRKAPVHIYSNPYQYQQKNHTGCSPMGSNNINPNELPATCSGFWEYLFNKINTRYQNEGNTMFKPCKCNAIVEESPRCDPIKCEKYSQPDPPPPPVNNYPESPPVDSCACPSPPPKLVPPCSKDQRQNPPYKVKASPKNKVECKCYSDNGKVQPKASPPFQYTSKPATSSGSDSSPRPCQIPHDEITATLTQKYNGEILCIHNPPCVLINGCLNLPPAKEKLTTDLWPVLNDDTGYHMYTRALGRHPDGIHYGPESVELRQCQITDDSCQYFPESISMMKSLRNADESCQYQIPSIEMKEVMITDDGCQYRHSQFEMHAKQYNSNGGSQYTPKEKQAKQEKNIQSICHHNPPCEVVRTCKKPKFDPQLQNSCVHVPMCERVPVCLMELKSQNQSISSCPHKPKCAELPICTRNFIVLTAKEEAATQVRPKAKMVCRHEPPCIMIPKCLARVCDSYIPYAAIPDCIHQPMCEMIPACCRKSGKEMVSVCSQFPNQCCIV